MYKQLITIFNWSQSLVIFEMKSEFDYDLNEIDGNFSPV